METCPKPAVPRPAIDGRQPRRLAIEANELPIRGAYFSYRSLFQLKFELLRLFTIPSVSHRDLVCLVSLVRTFSTGAAPTDGASGLKKLRENRGLVRPPRPCRTRPD
jgi:hypothetical protein